MTNLTDMMDTMTLDQCQAEIGRQIDSILSHYNDMKRAALLCILGEKAMEALKKEHPELYPQKQQERMAAIIKQYSDDKAYLQVKENAAICSRMDRLTDGLRDINSQVTALLPEYNRLLEELIRTRDSMSVQQAAKNNGVS